MLSMTLTLMLFMMPFLVSQKKIPHPGLHIGLWVSLFFWGKLHALFSILIFGVSIIYYVVQKQGKRPNASGPSGSATAHLWVPRSGARPLTGFLAILMIFCAFGNACQDLGAILHLDAALVQLALVSGFTGSLTGPIFFGALADKTGPFSAFMTVLFLALMGLGSAALSPDFPYLFPVGTFLMEAIISGIFTLMPLLLLQFYGQPQLTLILPLLLLFLTGLWTIALRFYDGAGALPQDYIVAMTFLLITALPLAKRAWKQRLGVL